MDELMETMEEIYKVFHQYLQNYQEAEAIRKEMRESHKKNRLRLQHMKKENEQHEKLLIDYMIQHNLPGLRMNGFVLLCDEKPKHANKQKKEEQIDEIFRRNQIDASSSLYREVKTLFVDSKLGDSLERRIRCQRFSEKT